ncbi:hypothetical protein H072_2924 [Dactylellina haptotyla CBS 200.50]|uniref:Coenzyme Q-binding protein COQ10 START domain-containing protein n=1 Tax=Dactylellina haptotyla (strain CBS 200.50) TaxID=1284197 RepID=S8C5V1_DACHA|nr:hypothetical protein H072_2924 [Dactylellina haptotyla CBS 200.50]
MLLRPTPRLASLRQKSTTPPLRSVDRLLYQPQHFQSRAFILPSPPAQRFSATRKIAYPPSKLFTLISDINSYSSFVPFCLSSTVTERTPPPDRLPIKADLRVGWGGVDETFTSRVRCEPHESNNTNSGDGGVKNSNGGMVEADATENSIFEVLRARWVINAANDPVVGANSLEGGDRESKVDLEIEYKFANPIYAVLSEAVMPSVAGKIIEAFEERAEKVLGRQDRS